MPHLSRRKLNYKTEKALLDSFEYVLNHSSSSELRKILTSLMSNTEKLMVAKRLGVAYMLDCGHSDTTIDDILKVTRGTVNKIELLMQTRFEGYQIAFSKLEQRKIKEGIKELFVDLAKYALPAAIGKVPTPRIK